MILEDFQRRIAQRLAVLPVGGALDANDADVIQKAYEGLLQELGGHNLAWWNADEAVPDEYADCLIGMVAALVVDDFTIPEPRRSQLIGQGAFGLPNTSMNERRLRALTRAGPSTAATEIEFF
jgi:hypothetical protein